MKDLIGNASKSSSVVASFGSAGFPFASGLDDAFASWSFLVVDCSKVATVGKISSPFRT